jgi:hypothetical protein
MTETIEATADIESQRAALEGRLAGLQTMSGVPTELIIKAQEELSRRQAAIVEVQRQINEIDSATGARVRHARDEAERQRLVRQEALRKSLVELEEQRLAGLSEAEAGIRQAVVGIRKTLEANAALGRTAYALSGERGTPMAMSEPELVGRLAARISAIMATVGKSYRGRFGGLVWTATSRFPVDQSWPEAEERLMAPVIVALVSTEKKDH